MLMMSNYLELEEHFFNQRGDRDLSDLLYSSNSVAKDSRFWKS